MISENLQILQNKIAETARGCGRDPEEIRLVAVSKRMSREVIEEAAACGQQIFGENYIQEAAEKIRNISLPLQWHFIGHLQSNKARQAAELFHMVETVDRFKIARLLDRYAGQKGRTLDILVQINVAREPGKSGVHPEDAEHLLARITELANLRVRGLMTMPPLLKDPAEVRPHFRKLKNLADRFAEKGYFCDTETVEISMGMSRDFTIAIEEGATLVRIGTALFGPRPA